jgi:hypothetical protein
VGRLVGELLPLAVAVAISPIRIATVHLMLLPPKASGTSAGFMSGWLFGIVGPPPWCSCWRTTPTRA